jgi:adenosine/AMP kinase
VAIEKPGELNLILGQAHFIKTVEDLHEAFVGTVPSLRFGIAFCEASGARLVRRTGNDDQLVELATRNARAIGAGHSFIAFLREGFPVNVLNQVKQVPEVCRVSATSATSSNGFGHVERDRQHERGVVLRRDLRERLQRAQRQRTGLARDDARGVGQAFRGLVTTAQVAGLGVEPELDEIDVGGAGHREVRTTAVREPSPPDLRDDIRRTSPGAALRGACPRPPPSARP